MKLTLRNQNLHTYKKIQLKEVMEGKDPIYKSNNNKEI